MKIGIAGCGNISGVYLENLRRFAGMEVVACADLDLERAREKAARYGVPVACSVEELLDDPAVDLILCRGCLVHFSFDDIARAVRAICASGSRLLLTTTFRARTANLPAKTGQWRPLNLEIAPLNWPPPIALIPEGCTENDGAFADKVLGLWRIDDLKPVAGEHAAPR